LETKKIRYFIFLKDIFLLSITCFGGAQAHLALFIQRLVKKHRYITEAELMELQSLCQFLPGPTSTQTITAIGFRLGGPTLAYLTLLVWILPATVFMGGMALAISFIDKQALIQFTQFIKPMAVGFILFAAYSIGKKVISSKTSITLLLIATLGGFYFRSPYITPIWIFLGGVVSSLKYNKQEKLPKNPIKIQWGNFILWAGVFIGIAVLGKITQSLPIRLFENFYRNGSLAFGGGHILKPLLFNEFVEFKNYLTPDEYLSGLAFAEMVPGPTFSIASYVGSLSMRDWGVSGQILGSLVASIGIFLPGIFLIFFVIRFWDQLKQYRGIRASLEGVNATSTGLTIAAGFILFQPMMNNTTSVVTVFVTLLILLNEIMPSYLLILVGLAMGYFL
jgi:chromate transporter